MELDLKRKKQLNMGKPPVYDRAALALSASEKDAQAERGQGIGALNSVIPALNGDGILGDISIDAASVSDPVLIRGDGQYFIPWPQSWMMWKWGSPMWSADLIM